MSIKIKKELKMYLTIVFLPLFGSIASGFFGFFIGSQGAGLLTILCLGITFLLSCFAFYEVALSGSPCFIKIMPWFDSELFSFSFDLSLLFNNVCHILGFLKVDSAVS